MTVKKTSLVISSIIAFAIVLIVVLFFFLSRRINELNAAASNRFYTILLVDELRKSSEELTRQAQMYAATGSAEAEAAYNKTLMVRNGQEPRPHGAYAAPGQKRVLLDLLKEYGITDAEFKLVEKANALSDDLVAQEIEAMNAVKGVFKDSNGEYTVRAEPDRDFALSLVYSDSYFDEVRRIMSPLDEFQDMVFERTGRSMEEAQAQQKTTEIIVSAAVALILLAGIYIIVRYSRDLRKTITTMKDMREADELTRIMFNATPLSINLIGNDLTFIDCNDETIKLFGITDKQKYLNNFFAFSPEYQPNGRLSKEFAAEHLTAALKEGYRRAEWTHKKQNGELIPCEVDLVRIKYKGGYALAGYAHDLREIKAATAKMNEAYEYTQILIDAMPLCCVLFDKDYNVLTCNQSAVELFKAAKKEDVINSFFDFSPEYQPDGILSREAAQDIIGMAHSNGYATRAWTHKSTDGELIPCEAVLVRVKYKDDYVVAGYAHDLREIRAIEAEAHEANERTAVMFNAMPLCATYWTRESKVIDCNEEVVRLFGVSSKNEYTERFFDLSPEYQPNGKLSGELAFKNVTRAFEEGYCRFEWMHRKLDGESLPCEITLVRVKHQGDYFVAGYTRDLREIKAAETKLREADERTQIMLDATPISCSLIDRKYRFIDCNKEALKLFGAANKQDYLNRFYEFSPQFQPDGQNSQDKAFGLFKKVFDEGYAFFEWLHINAAGEFIPSEVILIRVKYKEGYILAGYTRDMREVKAQEAQKLKAEKQKAEAEAVSRAKSNFLARVSHEIRTPMNAILGITEIQLQKENLPQDMQEALGKIYNSGYLLLGIINEILDLSKIESGKLELIQVQYDVASLIHDTVQLNLARFDSKPIDFKLEVDENIPAMLTGDELRMKQILNNVLSNAFKYTSAGEVALTINIEPGDDTSTVTVVFRISDTGQGMTQDQVAKLFTEYTRFNLKANRTTEGAGLGMSIARQLIQMMGGEIFVESEPNKGSVFTVRVPQGIAGESVLGSESVENLRRFRTDKTTRMKKSPQIVREYMPYGRVLAVDDVETNLYVMRGLLAPYGLSLETVISGFEAIDKIKDGASYDIIFMDHFMPKMDGMEAAKIIRDMGYKQPIIALTANALAGQAEVFLNNGFDGYISKPIDIRQLNALLNKLIRDKYPLEIIETARRLRNSLKKKSPAEAAPSPDIQKAFIRDAGKAIAAIESIDSLHYRSDDDVQTYIIYVHAMKGALANIGEAELSALALKLEDAGREGNTALLAEETHAFLNELKALIAKMDNTEDREEAAFTEADKTLLHEKLRAIQDASAAYDRKTAYDLVLELRQRAWPRHVRELLDTIGEHLLHSDFEDAANAARNYRL